MGLELVGKRDPHLRCCSHSLQNPGMAHTTHTSKTIRVAKSGWEDLGHLSYSIVFPGIWNSLTSVWVNSGSWWWAGRPGVLRFMGSQRVRHDWATALNCTHGRPPWQPGAGHPPSKGCGVMSQPWVVYLLSPSFPTCPPPTPVCRRDQIPGIPNFYANEFYIAQRCS